MLTFLFWVFMLLAFIGCVYEYYDWRKNKDALDILERYANDGDDS
jgi:hypothetical protein